MYQCITYDGSYTFTENGLFIGENKVKHDYIIVDEQIRFLSNGKMYVIDAKKPYMIEGTTMCFANYFEDLISNYAHVMKNITMLIFDDEPDNSIFYGQIVLTSRLTHVIFGYSFNRQIILTPRLTHVIFGCEFNNPIILTPRLTHIVFGFQFNRQIVLTPRLSHISFGRNFDQPIVLAKHLTYIKFGYRFNKPIVLNRRLIHVTFQRNFNQRIILTEHLKRININDCNNSCMIDNLPNNITYINIILALKSFLKNIPSSTKKITHIIKYY